MLKKILGLLIFVHYLLILKKLKSEIKVKYNDTLHSANLTRYLCLELFVCSAFTPPGLDFKFSGKMLGGTYTYSLNDMIVILSLAKCYVLLRLYFHFCRWREPIVDKLCKQLNITNIDLFPFKCELKYRPFTAILVATLITLGFISIIIRIVEM